MNTTDQLYKLNKLLLATESIRWQVRFESVPKSNMNEMESPTSTAMSFAFLLFRQKAFFNTRRRKQIKTECARVFVSGEK